MVFTPSGELEIELAALHVPMVRVEQAPAQTEFRAIVSRTGAKSQSELILIGPK